jgi:hypothetical protein
MNLYIQIQDGQPINHPAFEDNLLQAFGAIPENWEPFVRIECPIPTIYQILETPAPVYQKVNNVWTDVWPLRDMTDAEKTAKQQEVITAFNQREQASNWSAWTLDETTNTMVPPIPRPEEDQVKLNAGIRTFWCGADSNWKDTPVCPEGNYKFDFFAWGWVAR